MSDLPVPSPVPLPPPPPASDSAPDVVIPPGAGYKGWGILELFGEQLVAGFAKTVIQFSFAMIAVDVPGTIHYPRFTRYFNQRAVYSFQPCTMEQAKDAAEALRLPPIPNRLIIPHSAPPVRSERKDGEAL